MKTLVLLTVILAAFTSCDGNNHKTAFVSAKDGVNGKSCTVSKVNSATTISCEDGSKALVYDGSQGAAGPQGLQGIQGPKGDTGSQGLPGAPGKNGSNGLNGADGKSSLIKMYSATTAQCANGGILIVSFLDVDNNGQYTSNIDTSYQQSLLCNQVVVKYKDNSDDKDCDKEDDDSDEEYKKENLK
jgi:hypothetical protein